MIHVDETDPLGDVPPAFPYREVEIQRGVDAKQLYDLSLEVGRGKFGVVYKCKEKSSGIKLAAKFIQIVKKGDRRNIEREVHMMNVLHHPKIAQLYAAYEFDRTFCVMLELVEGGELFDRVLEEKFVLTEKACSIFMRQICDAVAYIHGNNIIHLDMKPENILCLTESGNRIKIIDFGLAREYDPDNKLQVLFGTPEFVAPEVVNFEAISFATDMWSIGVIAYVLVSGLSPFAGEDDIQTMGNITIGRYDFLDEAFDTVSEEAIDFINRCLVKEQKERLTAEDALKHKWIKRKPQYHPSNKRPSITSFKPVLLENNNKTNEIDKDNLKELVEKWNECPNNRYTFDHDSENIISPSGEALQLRRPSMQDAANGNRRGSIARGDQEGSKTDEYSSQDELGGVVRSNNASSSSISDSDTSNSSSVGRLPVDERVTNPTPTLTEQSPDHGRPSSSADPAPPSTPSPPSPPSSSSSHVSQSQPSPALTADKPTVAPSRPPAVTSESSPAVKVRDDLRKLSDLLKLSTNTKDVDASGTASAPHATTSPSSSTRHSPSLGPEPVSPVAALSTADLDSELESLKSKVKFKTSRAQNKLNELAQRPDFLANDPFKLQTFRFLPKSISLCNEDSVFKENYTKFCDRNANQSPLERLTLPRTEEKVKTSTRRTTTTSRSTTSSSATSASISVTTVKKTVVKQQRVLLEDTGSSGVPAATAATSATVKRTKFRVNQMSSRDVPVAASSVAQRYLERNRMLTSNGNTEDDCFIKVLHTVNKKHSLEQKPVERPSRSEDTVTANNLRNSAMKLRSLSVDWDAEAVENRSMKSINSFLKRHAVASSAVKQIQAQIEATISHK